MIINRFFQFILQNLIILVWITISILILLLSGCLSLRPTIITEQFMLNYEPASLLNLSPLNIEIKINRFSATQEIMNTDMVIQSEYYQRRTLDYYHWRIPPTDQISDYLTRDLRASKLFRRVVSYYDLNTVRFTIEGIVEKFYLVEKNNKKSSIILELNITVLDNYENDLLRRLIFQQNYTILTTLNIITPQTIAQGFSWAMAQISALITKDLYLILEQRIYKKSN